MLSVVLALVVATGCSPSSPSRTAPDERPGSAVVAPGWCRFKPNDDNTGSRGALEARDGEDVVLDDGASLSGARVHDLTITGEDVVVRDVEATGAILITGDRATLEHVTTTGVSVSSASGTVVRYANIGHSATDGIHLTSDRRRLVRNVVLSHNFVHSPDASDDAHYDGTQVRGVDGLLIECSTYDPGPYRPMFNANVFLEDANGGAHDVTIRSNWLAGSGFAVMMDGSGVRLIDNRISDPHWGSCYLGASTSPESVVIRGNVNERTGDSDPMCRRPAATG
jgi:hypothetical protein